MTGRIKFTILAALLMTITSVAAACGGGDSGGSGGSGGSEGETLTVASNIAYRPFEFIQDGEPVGFDIDLMSEVADRAGFEVEFQNVQFDGIIPGLTSGTFDAAISAMTITEERDQQVDFSDPYFNADQSLLVPADSDIQSTDDLSDATVGVELGTTGAMQATEYQEAGQIADVRTFDTIEDAFTALENGQVDAIINDLPVSQNAADNSDGALEIVEIIPTGEQYGIAFPPGSDLVGPANEALQEIKDDGTYAEIYEEWIGREPEEIP